MTHGTDTPKTQPADVRDNAMTQLLTLLKQNLHAQRELAAIMVGADIAAEQFLSQRLDQIALAMDINARAEPLIEELTRELVTAESAEKGIPTPYGTPKLTKSTKLEVTDEAATLQRISAWALGQFLHPALAGVETIDPDNDFIRTKYELNLEALEKLDDEALNVLGIVRVIDQKFSLKLPASVTPSKLKAKLKASKEEPVQ